MRFYHEQGSMISLILSLWGQISLVAYKLNHQDHLIFFANKLKSNVKNYYIETPLFEANGVSEGPWDGNCCILTWIETFKILYTT